MVFKLIYSIRMIHERISFYIYHFNCANRVNELKKKKTLRVNKQGE